MNMKEERGKNFAPGKLVFCVTSSRIQANRIVDHLTNAGFPPADVSVIFPNETGEASDQAVADADRGGNNVAIVGFGLAVGGVLGWLAGREVFSLPGFGPLAACGPIVGMLKRATRHAPGHDVKAALVGMGVKRKQAAGYEENVSGGHVLVCFHANDWRDADAARRIFQAMDASNISILGDKASIAFPFKPAAQQERAPAFSTVST